MKNTLKVLVPIVVLAIVLAGVLYWQKDNKLARSNQNQSSTQTPSNSTKLANYTDPTKDFQFSYSSDKYTATDSGQSVTEVVVVPKNSQDPNVASGGTLFSVGDSGVKTLTAAKVATVIGGDPSAAQTTKVAGKPSLHFSGLSDGVNKFDVYFVQKDSTSPVLIIGVQTNNSDAATIFSSFKFN